MVNRELLYVGDIELIMLVCRVGPLRKAEEEKVRAERAAAVAGFRSLLSEKGEISSTSRWSKVKEVSVIKVVIGVVHSTCSEL